jgi:protein O-mannosyl-transferase
MKRKAPPSQAPSKNSEAVPPENRLSAASQGWWIAGIFVAVLIAYWPALHGTFIWDDDGHITRPDLQSLDGLRRMWFELGATQQYYPVLHSAFWLEHFFFGTQPAGYHVLNVLLHATAACLFAAVLRRLAVPGAWFAALLFALHPVCVESVAWVSEQKNTLSLVWYLLATLAYLRFERSRRLAHYLVATGFFLLALGTKTVTATLPAALLVIFWWQRGRLDRRRDVLPLLPWFCLAVGAGVLTAWVEHSVVGATHNDFSLDPVEHVLLAGRIICFYLGKLIVPADLSFVYPRWEIDVSAWWQYAFPAALLLLVAAAWRWPRRRGAIAAGLLYVGSLFPALGFVNVYPFVFSFVADHFQYLASLGFFALGGAALAALRERVPPPWTFAVPAILLVSLAALTWQQSATYRNPETLYKATLAKNPAAWLAHNNLANLLVGTGRAREAIPHLEAAVKLQPNSADIENSFGYALLNLQEPEAAIPHFERALRVRPDFVFAYNNLGLAQMTLGRLDAAEVPLRNALRLKPDYPEANLNLGLVLAQSGKSAEALEHFAAAVRLRPNYTEAEFNWAIGLALSGRLRESFPHFDRAARLAPTRPDIQNMFGRALALDGRLDDAITRYRAALQLEPNFAEAHANLAEALQQLGRREEAAVHRAQAAQLGWKN